MALMEEVQLFLQDFKAKLGIWGIVFRDDRRKNTQTLLTLDMRAVDRLNIIKALEVVDYSEGPKCESLNHGADMWVFGKIIKGQEVYIKITLGRFGSQVICISFHLAEYSMVFPLKINHEKSIHGR